MSNAVSALQGAAYEGYARIEERGLRGMITLRGNFADAKFKKAIKALAGVDVPAQTSCTAGKTHVVAWMARAVFRISGDKAREVICKLAPVDMSPKAFPAGHFRRTRLAQTPAAFWMPDAQTVELICFRSVADYVFGLLSRAAMPG